VGGGEGGRGGVEVGVEGEMGEGRGGKVQENIAPEIK